MRAWLSPNRAFIFNSTKERITSWQIIPTLTPITRTGRAVPGKNPAVAAGTIHRPSSNGSNVASTLDGGCQPSPLVNIRGVCAHRAFRCPATTASARCQRRQAVVRSQPKRRQTSFHSYSLARIQTRWRCSSCSHCTQRMAIVDPVFKTTD